MTQARQRAQIIKVSAATRRERRSKVKSIKMVGLAALAALMAMAFVGVSSAMAESTALCKADESPCSAGNQVSHVHETTLTGNLATLLNSVGNVTCDVLFLGDTSGGNLGTPLVLSGNFTYTSCKRGSENCTFTEVNGPATIRVLKTAAETAALTGEWEWTWKCGIFINCTYNSEGLEATVKGPLTSSETNGSASLSEQEMNKVGPGICPSVAKLDITTTPLTATYISS